MGCLGAVENAQQRLHRKRGAPARKGLGQRGGKPVDSAFDVTVKFIEKGGKVLWHGQGVGEEWEDNESGPSSSARQDGALRPDMRRGKGQSGVQESPVFCSVSTEPASRRPEAETPPPGSRATEESTPSNCRSASSQISSSLPDGRP